MNKNIHTPSVIHTQKGSPNQPIPNSFLGKLNNLSPYSLVLLSQLVVLVPHFSNLPVWLTLYGVIVIFSQLPAIKNRMPWALKNDENRVWRSMQLIGFTLGLMGIYLTYRTAFGLDVGISFLLLCLISKLLELHARRDAYVVLNLSLFVLAGAFLMDQGISTSLLVFVGVLAILYAMIAHNDAASISRMGKYQANTYQPRNHVELQKRYKNSQIKPDDTSVALNTGRSRSLALLAILAIPFMVVLFVFFPRLPPLWHINLSGAGVKTGMSDSMSPGDFASLSQSTELAFRVLFDGDIPSNNELYFRGLVFNNFDGKTWKASNTANKYAKLTDGSPSFWLKDAVQIPKQTPISYTVMMQPTNQKWLFALDTPYPRSKDALLTREFVLEADQEVTSKMNYQALWLKGVKSDLGLLEEQNKAILQDSLTLPDDSNPKTRQYARKLFEQAQKDPATYSNAILNWIRNDNFSYTLEPTPLFDERIDEFLFNTKQGFCEHYASAYTFLMRAVGIPARVVVGYQGGELGQDGESWEVRQMDAHAWSEIWLENQGWVRVDPTAAIAPERVNSGMNSLTQTQGVTLFGEGAGAQLRYQQFKLLKSMRQWADYAEFIWQRDVVGFDEDKQKKSLLDWFNLKNKYSQILIMFGLLFSAIVIFVGTLFWRRRKIWHPIDKPLIKLSKRMEKYSLERKVNEGMLSWLERLDKHAPQSAHTDIVAKLYRHLRYSKQGANEAQRITFFKLVSKIKPPK